MVNLDAATVKHRTKVFLSLFFFFKGCSSIHGSAPWSADASLCMSVFLSTTRIFQDKIHLHSETKGRAEPVLCKSEWMA